jgi:hypothetical protein
MIVGGLAIAYLSYISRKRMRMANEMALEVARTERLRQLQQLFDEHAAAEGVGDSLPFIPITFLPALPPLLSGV